MPISHTRTTRLQAVSNAIDDYSIYVNRAKLAAVVAPSVKHYVELPLLIGPRMGGCGGGGSHVMRASGPSLSRRSSSEFRFTASSVYIDKLPEIYDSMLFMGQAQCQRRRQKHRNARQLARQSRRRPSSYQTMAGGGGGGGGGSTSGLDGAGQNCLRFRGRITTTLPSINVKKNS